MVYIHCKLIQREMYRGDDHKCRECTNLQNYDSYVLNNEKKLQNKRTIPIQIINRKTIYIHICFETELLFNFNNK